MSMRWRLALFCLGAAGIAVLFCVACRPLPGPEALRSRYQVAINAGTFAQRNITDAVTAVNFDYRGFDTVGEEFILFVSVMGSLVLLRQADQKHRKSLPDAVDPSRDVPGTEAIRFWTLLMVAPKLLFGIYVVIHGQLTPGGGFQGGVILATAVLIVYLGENFDVFKRLLSHGLVEMTESAGAAGFVLIGFIAIAMGHEYLTNVLPLGKSHELTSGGTIPLISLATGLEVAAGFVILLYAFLQETLVVNDE